MRQLTFAAVFLIVCGCANTAPPTPPSTSEMIRTSLGDTLKVTGPAYAPKILQRVAPLYPGSARANGTSGPVRMNALISAAGDVVDVEIIEGLPDGLSESAARAVRQWKFAPTLRDGTAIPVLFEVTINFKVR